MSVEENGNPFVVEFLNKHCLKWFGGKKHHGWAECGFNGTQQQPAA